MALAVVLRRAALQDALKQRIGPNSYKLWFADHTTFRLRGGALEVGVPNLHFQEWLGKKYIKDIMAAAKDILGRAVNVSFKIDPQLFQAQREAEAEAAARPAAESKKKIRVELPPPAAPVGRKKKKPGKATTPSMFPDAEVPPPRPTAANRLTARRWFELKDFVVGSCNRVAHAAAVSVVESPGQEGNPLVVHGPVGTGKTHLLEGIFTGLRKRSPGLTVRYVTAEEFTHRFVQSMRAGKLSSFRRQFRDCDVLLLDNLHFFAKKKATLEEFLHTYDRLAHRGAQVVVTIDSHPRLAEYLPPELVDRLLGGTVWGVQPPDGKTRLEILRSKATGGAPTIPDEVLQGLAQQLRGNVRELEGAVRNLRHYAKVEGKPVTTALAQEALGDLLRHAAKVVGLADIDSAVCNALKLKPGALQSHARSWSVSHPRMVAVYLARKHTSASYADVGKHFGGRNHSTAVAAEKKVRQWLDEDAPLSGGTRPMRVREVIELAEKALGI
ncbi:MAG: chromosomal replication initiator protein DnaA [Gemmataceae bacterium]|nr:chromosomal replication initiator protein DnaA [Gemmataceae bacterium]